MTPQDPLTPSVPLSTSGLSEQPPKLAFNQFGTGLSEPHLTAEQMQRVCDSLSPVSGLSEGEGAHCEMCGAGRGLGFRCPKCAETNAALSPAPVLQGDVAGLSDDAIAGRYYTSRTQSIGECGR